jgi:hypothetical protein
MAPSTPTPVTKKEDPHPPRSPFTSRAGPPEQKSIKSPSLRSRKSSPFPAPVSAERAAQINEFNNGIKWLREHIPADVTGLRKQIKHFSDLQQARRSRSTTMARSASFWTFSPVKLNPDSSEPQESPVIEGPNIDEYGNVIRVETKAQRIKRLREEDWRIGIRSKHSLWKGTEYYDKFCETALAELGPTGYGSREWLQRWDLTVRSLLIICSFVFLFLCLFFSFSGVTSRASADAAAWHWSYSIPDARWVSHRSTYLGGWHSRSWLSSWSVFDHFGYGSRWFGGVEEYVIRYTKGDHRYFFAQLVQYKRSRYVWSFVCLPLGWR